MREDGYYWVRAKPSHGWLGPITHEPEVARWDSEWPCWHITGSDIHQDDCDYDVLSERLTPPT